MKLELSHIGMVVENVSEFVQLFEVLGFREITNPATDPIQKVAARFVTVADKRPIHLELLEPTHGDSPISNFLKKRGGGLHHLCFEVADIERATDDLVRNGFKMVSAPVACTGYDKSFGLQGTAPTKVAFFLLSERLLVELVQKGQP